MAGTIGSLWLGLLCLACHPGSAPIGNASADLGSETVEQQKALVLQWIEEGFNQRHPAVVDDIFAPGLTVNGVTIGRRGLQESMTRHLTGFPDLEVTITEVVAEGEEVVIWYRAQGTHLGEFEGVPPTGRRVSWTGADLLRFGGGEIVEARFLSDALGLQRQLGGVSDAAP